MGDRPNQKMPKVLSSLFIALSSSCRVKPDGVQRGLVADILGRFERKGYLIKGLKLFQCTKARPAWSLH